MKLSHSILKQMKPIYIYTIFLALLFSACTDLIMGDDMASGDPVTNFDYLWEECRDNYAFFDIKDVDWDEVYSTYRPQISADMGELALFDVCYDMLLELKDGHVNLVSPFNVAKYEFSLTGEENFDWRLIKENYLSEKYMTTGALIHDTLANRQIGYVRYSSFSDALAEFDIDFVLSRYKNTKGIVLDIRNNTGGSIDNIYTLLSRFTDQKREMYTSQIKTGPGTDDFSDAQTAYTEPGGSFQYTEGKVVVLTNRACFSATSFFTLGMRVLPQVLIMGDTTGGGLGAPNGGQLPNGWTYRMSVTRTLTPEGDNYENGIPPDEYVAMDEDMALEGRDTMLDAAMEYILK